MFVNGNAEKLTDFDMDRIKYATDIFTLEPHRWVKSAVIITDKETILQFGSDQMKEVHGSRWRML